MGVARKLSACHGLARSLPRGSSSPFASLGRPRRFIYDNHNRLTGVNIDIGLVTPNWIPFARFRYDPFGRRIAAIYDNQPDGTLDKDYVEFYGYDDSWRLTTVWRQGAVRAEGPGVGSRPDPVLYERFLHNPGWGARLDAPMMSQVNDDWDTLDSNGQTVTPNWDRTRTFAQDRFGNVIAVTDNGLNHVFPVVRISYSQTGAPSFDSEYDGADIDNNGSIDGGDLAAFFVAFEAGEEIADLDQNGAIDGGDQGVFFEWFEAGFMGDHDLNDQRFLYRGYWWDDKLEMYHVRHRVYDPRRMIWLQRDPLGQLAGPDEYAYCEGEPRDLDDPMGLLPRAELNERDHVYDTNGNIQYGYSISYYERDRFLFVPTSEERYLGKKFYPYADPRKPYPNLDTDAYSMQLAKDIAWGADIAGDMHDGVRDGAKVVGTAAMIIVPGPDDAVLAALFSRNALKGIKIVGGKIIGITKKGVEVVVEATEKEALAIKLALQKAEKAEEAGLDATKAANAAENAKDAGKAGTAPTTGSGCALPSSQSQVRSELEKLPQGKQRRVRTVDSEKELSDLYDKLTEGGTTVDPGTYPGTVRKLPDGTEVRMRPTSKSGGSTIDITYPDGSSTKVHVR